LSWKSDDTLIVGVTSQGYVHLVDFKQQMIIKTMRYSDYSLKTCKFSFFKKDLLAASGDEGVIIIFDVAR